MQIGIMAANVGPFVLPENLAHLAQSAEQVGVESLWTVEHVVIPVGYTAKYPYNESGRIDAPENFPLPDPILPLAYCAAVTKNLRLGTGVLILPQRHPAYVAKSFATLDVLSNGRALLGVGIGWLHEEFESLGIPFDERAARTEESIRAIRSLWADKPEPFRGDYYRWEAVESNPKPVQAGGVPIIVGGNVKGAARRAARLGNGFFPAKADEVRLRELIATVGEECERIGRDPAEVEITIGSALELDAIKRLQDLGVSRVMTGAAGWDRDTVTKNLEKMGNEIIARL